MTRLLPGVYSSLNDLSFLPEGANGLAVAIVLQSNKGPIGSVTLQTNPTDLLTNYTFSGKPKTTDDKSFFTALNILQTTNLLYVSRAAKNALYGGLIIKKEDLLGNVTKVTSTTKTIRIAGDVRSSISASDTLRVYGVSDDVDGRYTVVSTSYINSQASTDIVVSEDVADDYTYSTGTYPQGYKTRQPIPFDEELIGAITGVSVGNKTFTLAGDMTAYLPVGDKIEVKGSTSNDGVYTVVSATYDTSTVIVVSETVPDGTIIGDIYRNSIVDPENYEFKSEDLAIITGVDQGSYNSDLKVTLVSYNESPDSLTEEGVCELTIYDATTNAQLELPYTFNLDVEAKATDGTPLFLEEVVKNSSYIQAIVNPDAVSTDLPCDTLAKTQLSGGYDGDTLVDADLVAALSLFEDKVIPISILANGSIETETYHKAMIALAEQRQDIFAFLNSRLVDEEATTNSAKASNVVTYKKSNVSSNSFYAAMYTPHVNITDVFNSREITVGADAKIIPGWVKVINQQGYPYAFAGYRYGKVDGMDCNWRIGDASGEGTVLNDASVNFIAYDAIQGMYVAWTQNTLQVANSVMRNIGAVLNILDMKQTLMVYLRQYLQLPITADLRREIIFKVTDYMDGIKSANRVSDYAFQDTSTALDISNNSLKYVLTIAPVGYVQQLYLVINIVNQTFDFKILQSI